MRKEGSPEKVVQGIRRRTRRRFSAEQGGFPQILSADVAVIKRLSFFGRRVDVGVQAYNLTSHDNPRDVVSNPASPSFGEFRNSIGSTIALKLGLGL